MEINYNQKNLFIGDVKRDFEYEISRIEVLEDMILVLLTIPQSDNNAIDNIYAVSYEGKIIWRVESLKKLYPDQLNLPYDYMTVDSGKAYAVDFYGRRYFFNIYDGKIIKRDVVK